MKTDFAVLGIHTGVGKTVCSAVITEALQCDYWKPVQAGDLNNSDTIRVSRMVSNKITTIHPEAYRLTQPMSPHAAAAIDGVNYNLNSFVMPASSNSVLLETAGGVMSPLSDEHTMIDLVNHLQLPAILVVRHYLGSINHSMLCLEVLRQRKIPLLGVIVSGDRNEASEAFLNGYGKVNRMAFVPEVKEESAEEISRAAAVLAPQIKSWWS